MSGSELEPYGAEVGRAFDLCGGGEADDSWNGLAEPAEIPSPIAALLRGPSGVVWSSEISLIATSSLPLGVPMFNAPTPNADNERVGGIGML
jgi:hypothetical protein